MVNKFARCPPSFYYVKHLFETQSSAVTWLVSATYNHGLNGHPAGSPLTMARLLAWLACCVWPREQAHNGENWRDKTSSHRQSTVNRRQVLHPGYGQVFVIVR